MCLENTLNIMCFVCVCMCTCACGAHTPVFFLIIFSIAQKHSMTLRKNFGRFQEMYISLLNYSESGRLLQNFLTDYFKSRHSYLKSESTYYQYK
jgi:hypothetical protein